MKKYKYETKVKWNSIIPEIEDYYTPGEIIEIKKEKKKHLKF